MGESEVQSLREQVQRLQVQLATLQTTLDSFNAEFRRGANGVGYPRCAERNARLGDVEKSLALAHQRIGEERRKREEETKTIDKKLWAALVCAVLGLINFVVPYLKGGG